MKLLFTRGNTNTLNGFTIHISETDRQHFSRIFGIHSDAYNTGKPEVSKNKDDNSYIITLCGINLSAPNLEDFLESGTENCIAKFSTISKPDMRCKACEDKFFGR